MVPWSHLLWKYAVNGDLSAIQKLFADGKASPYDLNPVGSSGFFYAGNRDPSRLFKFFQEQGVDMDHSNENGRTPNDLLWEYSFAGYPGSETADAPGSMLRDSDHVQARGLSKLHKIILGLLQDDPKSELETSTAEINVGDSKNMTPLCWAVIRNDLQAVEILLAFGANPNIVDDWGRTPLYFARNTGICKALLKAGLNIRITSLRLGHSPLHLRFKLTGRCYLENDTIDTMNILVNAGIDIDVRDDRGQTPLLNAVYSGYIFHARRLLELGANPNAIDKSSRESAIHYAVLFDRHEMISLLLKYGADYTTLSADGKNIAHMAASSAGTKTVSVLAESNLVNLDVSLRCKEGKTPADYISERTLFSESEQGLHAEFERFIKSIPPLKTNAAGNSPSADTVYNPSDAFDSLHLPGAYPVLRDTNLHV